MSLPDAASLEAFSLAELLDLVGCLIGGMRRLHFDNVALQAGVDAQQATIVALRAENQALRDEVARLKGLPPRPPSRPSGMEQATQPGGETIRMSQMTAPLPHMGQRTPPGQRCSRTSAKHLASSSSLRERICKIVSSFLLLAQ